MIFVYQMSKVGSQSWVRAIAGGATSGGRRPRHAHFIVPKNLARLREIDALTGDRQTVDNMFLLRIMLRNDVASRSFVDDARRRNETVRVLSGMRDPVARSLSIVHFFADFLGDKSRALDRRHGGDAADTVVATLDGWQAALSGREPEDSFAALIAFLIGAYRTWFTDELEATLGVRLGERAFPAAEGAELLLHDGVEALIYRVEDMCPDAPAHRALLERASDFLGIALSALPEINTAAGRRSFPRYQAARALLRLPRPMLDAIYDHPVVTHFYSEGEIAALKARWG